MLGYSDSNKDAGTQLASGRFIKHNENYVMLQLNMV